MVFKSGFILILATEANCFPQTTNFSPCQSLTFISSLNIFNICFILHIFPKKYKNINFTLSLRKLLNYIAINL